MKYSNKRTVINFRFFICDIFLQCVFVDLLFTFPVGHVLKQVSSNCESLKHFTAVWSMQQDSEYCVGETTTLCLSCTRINLLLRITSVFFSASIARTCVCFAPCAGRSLLPYSALFCQQGMSCSACLFLQKALLKALENSPTGFSRTPCGDLPATWVFLCSGGDLASTISYKAYLSELGSFGK